MLDVIDILKVVKTGFFTGQLLSRVICNHCSKESIAFDNTLDLALPFSKNTQGDIIKMIESFLQEETILSDYYCSQCKCNSFIT